MAKFYSVLPSRQQVALVFLAIIFPISFWSIIVFFREMPSYLMRMNAWDILGVLAYTLSITLLDSLLLIAILVFLAVLIPHRFFRDHFAAQGIIIGYLIILWAISYHYISSAETLSILVKQSRLGWSIWLGSFFVIAIILNFQVIRSSAFQQIIIRFVDRLSVLSTIYIVLNSISLIIVVMRNLGVR